MYFLLALLSPPYSSLHYAIPDYLPKESRQAGLRVVAPLGKSLRVAVVLGQSAGTDTFEDLEIKNICWPLEARPFFDAGYMEMIRQLALRRGVTPGYILGHVLPAGLRSAQTRLRHFENGKARLISPRSLAALSQPDLENLSRAWSRGEAEMLPPRTDAAAGEYCRLLIDPPWPVRPSATRQIAVLEYLLEKGTTSRRALLKALAADCTPALESLMKQGCVHIGPPEEHGDAVEQEEAELLPPPPLPFTLSKEQEATLTDLHEALHAPEAVCRLLFGITGSGKTAVYIEAAKNCLALGKSVLLLAPEVALAQKLLRDARLALPAASIILFHGYQSSARREEIFRKISAEAEPRIVVGTRSAVFLPLSNPGLIVLDEEHDASFKQEEGFSYHAKEIAWFRAKQNKSLLVFGSATPDMKSFYAAQTNALGLSRLTGRVGGGALPEIRLVDINGLAASDALLAPESLNALKETIRKGEQAVVLLNRRGYAPHMYCLDCNEVPRCPHCAISLTLHKARARLLCHYCGHSRPFPQPCAKCKGLHYLPMGEGTERLTEALTSLLTPAKILRLDRDSTRRAGRAEEILSAFAKGEAQVLVGTQMLSKGHHFPQVTLALVADGDLGLNLPDYRAAERTFQLLVQSAGRAGRGSRTGQVLIQTRDKSHYCWNFIRQGDYEGFYEAEIARRKQRRYPPFTHLALVRVSFDAQREDAASELSCLAQALRAAGREAGVAVLGPAPAPLSLLRGRKRFHCLLKAQDWPSLRTVYAKAVGAVEIKLLRPTLDLDPVNML